MSTQARTPARRNARSLYGFVTSSWSRTTANERETWQSFLPASSLPPYQRYLRGNALTTGAGGSPIATWPAIAGPGPSVITGFSQSSLVTENEVNWTDPPEPDTWGVAVIVAGPGLAVTPPVWEDGTVATGLQRWRISGLIRGNFYNVALIAFNKTGNFGTLSAWLPFQVP